MKRELGIARCGLACCLCSENVTCNGCNSGNCPDEDFCENKKCSREKGLEHCYECTEHCRKGLLNKIKPYTFNLFVKRYGEEKLLDCLERNEQNGVVYHREGINGDYDYFTDTDSLLDFILNGKSDMHKSIIDYIEEKLSGNIRQTALNFAKFLQDNNIELIKDNGYWKDKIYYLCKFNGEYICFIVIKNPDEPHNDWTIWSEDSNAYEDANADDSVKIAAWKHVDHCGNCGSCGGGKAKNIFGKVFDDVCGCTFRIDNATQNDLPFLKKMVELRITEISCKAKYSIKQAQKPFTI